MARPPRKLPSRKSPRLDKRHKREHSPVDRLLQQTQTHTSGTAQRTGRDSSTSPPLDREQQRHVAASSQARDRNREHALSSQETTQATQSCMSSMTSSKPAATSSNRQSSTLKDATRRHDDPRMSTSLAMSRSRSPQKAAPIKDDNQHSAVSTTVARDLSTSRTRVPRKSTFVPNTGKTMGNVAEFDAIFVAAIANRSGRNDRVKLKPSSPKPTYDELPAEPEPRQSVKVEHKPRSTVTTRRRAADRRRLEKANQKPRRPTYETESDSECTDDGIPGDGRPQWYPRRSDPTNDPYGETKIPEWKPESGKIHPIWRCNNCTKKHMQSCSGSRPCQNCEKSNLDCDKQSAATRFVYWTNKNPKKGPRYKHIPPKPLCYNTDDRDSL